MMTLISAPLIQSYKYLAPTALQLAILSPALIPMVRASGSALALPHQNRNCRFGLQRVDNSSRKNSEIQDSGYGNHQSDGQRCRHGRREPHFGPFAEKHNYDQAQIIVSRHGG